ncbi:MAG: SpoIID/LytB domain-containing protein [Firmicutes bacterium]|nr:SpoIID/LytB domain-containing protein [Bacillota bacterium]
MKNPYLAIYHDEKLLATAKSKVRIKPASAGEFLSFVKLNGNGTFESKKYRGDIVVLQQDGALGVINELSVEEYISGVVPKEIPSSYPEETLKAMAVIARTFALSHRARHASEGYDLCSTVHCQAYGGVLAEDFSSSKAVEETTGEVILYQGEPADITYHSTCGGVGENIERVWDAHPCPYLVSVYDSPFNYSGNLNLSGEDDFKKFIDTPPPSFCKDSSRFRWKEEYTISQLQELFNKSIPVLLRDGKAFQKEGVSQLIVKPQNNNQIGELYSIKVAERSPRGRVLKLEINTSTGVYYAEKDAIRWLFSGGEISLGGLRSTLFYIEETGSGAGRKYVFHGGGWGHGVGMCQEGAFGMAKSGYNYIEIIKHYFPGVKVGGDKNGNKNE